MVDCEVDCLPGRLTRMIEAVYLVDFTFLLFGSVKKESMHYGLCSNLTAPNVKCLLWTLRLHPSEPHTPHTSDRKLDPMCVVRAAARELPGEPRIVVRPDRRRGVA